MKPSDLERPSPGDALDALLREAVRDDELTLGDPAAGFAKLRARIESAPRVRRPWRQWLRTSHGYPGWVWALQAIALVAALAWWWVAVPATEPATYRTLTNAPLMAAPDQLVLQLVFDPATSERDLRATLVREHALIVQGPSANGVYHVSVPRPPRGDLQALLRRWQGEPGVRFAALGPGGTQ